MTCKCLWAGDPEHFQHAEDCPYKITHWVMGIRGEKVEEGKVWSACPNCKALEEKVKRLEEYIGHMEKCNVCNEGFYGMCDKRDELRKRAGRE